MTFLRTSACLLVLWAAPTASGDDVLRARFETDYPAAAARLEQLFSRVKGSCRLENARGGDMRLPRLVDEADFAIDHGFEKVAIHRKYLAGGRPKHQGDLVFCVGKDTAFELFRLDNSTEYGVRGIGSTLAERNAYLTVFGNFLRAPQGVMAQRLSQIVASPGFVLKDAVSVVKDGRKLIKIVYEVGAREPKSQASVVLDPDAGWVVRSSEFRPGGEPGTVFSAEVTYDAAPGGVPTPRRVTLRDNSEVQTCEFTSWSYEPTPIEEFGMPFFGLPDISSKVKRTSDTRPYWFAGLGIAGVVVAFVLWRHSRAR